MKVIAFDGWTLGSSHLKRLVPFFNEEQIDFFLIHLGSWGNEIGRPSEEVIDNLLVRDISYYTSQDFNAILDIEKPDAVLFLSVDAFAHRALNRYCLQRGISSFHLNHGLITVIDTTKETPFEFNFFTKLYNMKMHIWKQIRYFLPVYAKALYQTNATFKEWFRFFKDIFSRIRGFVTLESASDCKTTANLVYIKSDISYSKLKYGYNSDEVIVVGNPDLLSFNLKENDLGIHLLSDVKKITNEVIYIDSATTDYGDVFKSKQDFVNYLTNTRDTLQVIGKKLVVKLHPSSEKNGTGKLISDAGIDICQREDFIKRLKKCSASIVEPSSASLIPALIGVPVFLAQYDNFSNQVFGNLLMSYPRSIGLKNLKDIEQLMKKQYTQVDSKSIINWISQNVGPLPASEMPKRVVEVIKTYSTRHA
jgi:hypothetical protein